MTLKHFIMFVLCCFFLTKQTSAQFRCGNKAAEEKLYEQNPELKDMQEKYDLQTQYLPILSKGSNQKSAEKRYVLPVVFHILHDYGTENISDEQVYDQIRILNEDYNKLNFDTILVWPEFDSIIGNINFEFRLAQIDPQGKPTNGIDRIPSKLTYGAPTGSNDNAKLNPWPRYKYINIWVVKNMINGVAGYAYRPASVSYHNTNSKKIDGIIILQDYIGSIGTGSPNLSRALTHEIGHYFNLQHPWGGTNEPGVACGDDGVTDTPGTKGWLTCPPNKNTTKICSNFRIENVQNFMEYSYCSYMFTNGQKLMMRNAIVDDIAERNILWSDENLVETGTADGMPLDAQKPLKADFKSSNFFVCEGKVLTLTDVSWNGSVDSRTWSADDNEAEIYDTEANVTNAAFFTAGKKTVNLSVSNSLGGANVSKNIFVSGDNATYWGFVGESFGVPAIIDKAIDRWIPNNYESQKSSFKFSANAGNFNKGSIYVDAYKAVNGEISEVISPIFNLSYITTATLSYYYSTATKTSNPLLMTDIFKVFYSINCGETWTLLNTKQGVSLSSSGGMHDEDFTPIASEWVKESIGLPLSIANKNVRFKFQYTAGENANNFYIDDVNIEGIVGLKEISNSPETLSVYPNPTSNTTTIKFNNFVNVKTKISVMDMVGKEVIVAYNDKLEVGLHEFVINTSSITNGIYLLKVEASDNLYFQKIVVNK